jgi:hypothetical protein
VDTLTASAILDRVAGVYAAAQTYQDKGLATTTFTSPERVWTAATSFITAYSSTTGQFRFEFLAPLPLPGSSSPPSLERRQIIFRDRNGIYQWSYLKGLSATESLARAVARATGVSKGSAHRIPALLMPSEIGGRKLTSDTDPVERIDDARLPTGDCYRIRRMLQTEMGVRTETVWIDGSSFLIRQVDTHGKQGVETIVDSRTNYEPLLDQPVPTNMLELNAPSEESAHRNAG